MPSFKEVLGIDIGSHSIKIVHAQRGRGRLPVMEWGGVHISDHYEDNQRLLQRFLETKGWNDLPALVMLGEDSLLHRTVDVLDYPGRSSAEILRQEKESLRGMSASEALHDHVEVSGPDRHPLLFVTYARADAAAASMRLPEECGLQVVGLRPNATALFNTVTHCLPQEKGVYLAVDLGHTSSSLVAGYRGNILFARQFNGGAEPFPKELRTPRYPGTDDSADETGRHPITIKVSSGMLVELDQGIMNWTEELSSCIALFRSQFPSEAYAPTRIILCGGGASIGSVKERVEMSLGISTTHLSELGPKEFPDDLGRYATATGLALAGVGRDRVTVDLLPDDRKENIALQWQRPYWSIGTRSLVSALLLLLGSAWFYLHRLDRRIEHLSQTRDKLNTLDARIAARTQDIRSLRQHITPLRSAVHNGHQVLKLMEALQGAKPESDWFTYIADYHSYEQETSILVPLPRTFTGDAGEPEGLSGSLQINQVIVEGYTPEPDLSTVRNMLETLRANPNISRADLMPDDRIRYNPASERLWQGIDATRFALEITLASP